jgi:DNA polymerase III subunit delta'
MAIVKDLKEALLVYPWLLQPVDQLIAAHRHHRLPHALLFSGMAGLGKSLLAKQLASCLTDNELSIQWVQPEEESDSIKVDQVRSLQPFIEKTSLHQGKKIVIFRLAEQMNVAASNALLKMLEEPQGNSLLILLTENSSLLLPTIVSRCQRLYFPVPSKKVAMQWLSEQQQDPERAVIALSLALGAPLKALQILQAEEDREFGKFHKDIMVYFSRQKTVVDVSAAWEKYPLSRLLHYLQLIIVSLLKRQQSVDGDLYAMYSRVLSAKRAAQAKVVLNTALAIERILLPIA